MNWLFSGSKEYAREELVAELGSALVASQYGITKTIKEDSAQYLGSWLDVLKESPEFLKTTLLDVKKASSMIAQRIDARPTKHYPIQPTVPHVHTLCFRKRLA